MLRQVFTSLFKAEREVSESGMIIVYESTILANFYLMIKARIYTHGAFPTSLTLAIN